MFLNVGCMRVLMCMSARVFRCAHMSVCPCMEKPGDSLGCFLGSSPTLLLETGSVIVPGLTR